LVSQDTNIFLPPACVGQILLSVMSLLAEPNTESPANVDAAKMWRENKADFKKRACQSVRKTLDM
jgi:ubiquitin-protein ligase